MLFEFSQIVANLQKFFQYNFLKNSTYSSNLWSLSVNFIVSLVKDHVVERHKLTRGISSPLQETRPASMVSIKQLGVLLSTSGDYQFGGLRWGRR